MPTPPLRRTIVTLRFPSSNPALISLARAILAALAANPLFANIEPPLAVVSAATDELDLAQIGAGTRARGAVETRDEKRVALVRLLVQLRIGVQKVADAHPADAEIIAASAGMSTKRPGGR